MGPNEQAAEGGGKVLVVVDYETRPTDAGIDIMRHGEEWPVTVITRIADRELRIAREVPDWRPGSGPAPRRAPVPTTAPAHVEDGASRASRRRMARAEAKGARK